MIDVRNKHQGDAFNKLMCAYPYIRYEVLARLK